jgi:large subunit ribosomal protein L31
LLACLGAIARSCPRRFGLAVVSIKIKFARLEAAIMAKAGIHPEWYPDAKVICNGEVVMTVGSTKPEMNVDVWSGNHPFFTGTQKIIDTEGRVERFLRKYGMASEAGDQK